jgi:hypothetical protein
VLHWVRTDRPSLRRGAELLGMPYGESLALMATHRIPSIAYEEGWLERELDTSDRERGFHLDPHGQVYQNAVRRAGEA